MASSTVNGTQLLPPREEERSSISRADEEESSPVLRNAIVHSVQQSLVKVVMLFKGSPNLIEKAAASRVDNALNVLQYHPRRL